MTNKMDKEWNKAKHAMSKIELPKCKQCNKIVSKKTNKFCGNKCAITYNKKHNIGHFGFNSI